MTTRTVRRFDIVLLMFYENSSDVDHTKGFAAEEVTGTNPRGVNIMNAFYICVLF